MNVLAELQEWYASQCGENWEDVFGIEIGTLDNPGWTVTIDLDRTPLEGKPFREIKELDSELDWVHCSVKGTKFEGAGGPRNLENILRIFLSWAKTA